MHRVTEPVAQRPDLTDSAALLVPVPVEAEQALLADQALDGHGVRGQARGGTRVYNAQCES